MPGAGLSRDGPIAAQELADVGPQLLAPGDGLLDLTSGLPQAQPEITRLFRDAYHDQVLASSFADSVTRYPDVRGTAVLRDVIAIEYGQYFGLPLTSRNVLVAPGSQAIFYYVCELMAQRGKKVRFTGPEYPGYRTHAGVQYDMVLPDVQDDHHGDFRYLPRLGQLDRSVGVVLLSRPGNPTGNVLSDAQLDELASECTRIGTLLVIDGAYAPPVPALCFAELGVPWNEHVVLTHSLSAAGFAGERIGFAMATEEVIDALAGIQARVAIAPHQLAQRVAAAVLAEGRLARVCREFLRPAYAERHGFAREILGQSLQVPVRFHAADGGPFLWMWCPELPVATSDVSAELSSAGALVVPGASFFLPELRSAPHSSQCLRVGLTGTLESLEAGLVTFSDVINRNRPSTRPAIGELAERWSRRRPA